MNKLIEIIGIPLDLGQTRRGVDMGPSAIRYAGLLSRIQNLGKDVLDAGNVSVPVREHLPADAAPGYGHYIAEVCENVYKKADKSIRDGHFPLFLGGDHSLAIGTIGGITDSGPCGVIWFDAHGDFNIPQTSPNGNIHGMPVALLLGHGIERLVNLGRNGAKIQANEIVMIGTRDLDYDEKQMLKDSGIRIYTMREIDDRGIGPVVRETLQYLDHLGKIHVSFDVDVLDPMAAPGVGTPATGGLTLREAHLAMELIADSEMACSMDVVEVNPILDHRNQSSIMSVDLICSLLGERVI